MSKKPNNKMMKILCERKKLKKKKYHYYNKIYYVQFNLENNAFKKFVYKLV